MNNNIPINIWDDFYEDNFVPENEIQQTYAYVEDSDIPHEIQEQYLKFLLNFIQSNIDLNDCKMSLEFHDSKNDYDNETVERCINHYGENFFYKRWEIKFKGITHEQLDKLVEELRKANLRFNELPFNIYSES